MSYAFKYGFRLLELLNSSPSAMTPDFHTFARPIRTVAVIGLGASGAPAARHFRDAGLEVTVFERQSQAGGIWNWSPESTPVSVPTPPPSRGAFEPTLQPPGVRDLPDAERRRFAPPNPVYWSLTNNVPTSTMTVSPAVLRPLNLAHPSSKTSLIQMAHPRMCPTMSSQGISRRTWPTLASRR